jgi:DNA invertase Pin-like site-specific DNA recombinase
LATEEAVMRSVSRVHNRVPNREQEGQCGGEGIQRRAVGYVRVSTDMQAADGLSLDAQRAAIKSYCESVGLHLLQIHEDVESGGRADRKGLASVIYNINLRKGWHVCKPVNERPHSDEDVKLKMHELRDRGTTYQGIANILNILN